MIMANMTSYNRAYIIGMVALSIAVLAIISFGAIKPVYPTAKTIVGALAIFFGISGAIILAIGWSIEKREIKEREEKRQRRLENKEK